MTIAEMIAGARGASPVLVSGDLLLRPPQRGDFDAWRAVREESRAHLTEWEQEWTAEEATRRAYYKRLDRGRRLHRAGRGLALFVFDRGGERLVGSATLSDIRAAPFQSGVLGYWIGAAFTRRGYGAAAAGAIVRYGFENLGLVRISAACQPGNVASQRLLAAIGFRLEGIARDYLAINGEFRDHQIHALTATDFAAQHFD